MQPPSKRLRLAVDDVSFGKAPLWPDDSNIIAYDFAMVVAGVQSCPVTIAADPLLAAADNACTAFMAEGKCIPHAPENPGAAKWGPSSSL
jgi:hypothetical protein